MRVALGQLHAHRGQRAGAWKQMITASSAVNLASRGTQFGTGMASVTSLMRALRSFQTSSPAKNSTMITSSQLKAPAGP